MATKQGRKPNISSSKSDFSIPRTQKRRSPASGVRYWRSLSLAVLFGLAACTNIHDNRRSSSDSRNASHQTAASPALSLANDVANPNSIVVFPEQLVSTGPTTLEDTVSLNGALAAFKSRPRSDDFSALESWVKQNPSSPWNVAVLTNLGLINYNAGYFSRAIGALETAWATGRHVKEYKAKLVVDRAVGELARMHARLGHTERLESLFSELAGRPLQGAATELITSSREALWMMRNEPETAFLCGPAALRTVARIANESVESAGAFANVKSATRGTTLADLNRLAGRAKMGYRAAFRSPGAPLPLPAVVHWKVNHFAAVTERANGLYRILDRTFGRELWISQEALDVESSGFYLIPESKISDSWRLATSEEAARTYGMGATITSDPDPIRPEDPRNCCETPQNPARPYGAPTYSIHSMLVSLHVEDTPLFYEPPRGPAMQFTVTYNQRENDRSANPSYTNFGPKWTFNWLSFIEDNDPAPGAPAQQVRHFVRGGGWRTYSGYDLQTGDFEPDDQTHARLVRDLTVSAPSVRYVRYLNDGSQEIFEYADGGTSPRRIFMTAYKDPTGNSVTMEYEYVSSSAQTRLKKIYDAVGQVTTIQYVGTTSRVSRITDPFGRYAEFGTSGPLGSISDAIGVTSTLSYASGTDRMTNISTPYLNTGSRDTAFEHYCEDESPTVECTKPNRWITVTDPNEEKERVEFRHDATDIPTSEGTWSTDGIPDYSAIYGNDLVANKFLQKRNTFYWNKEAMKKMGTSLDYTKAHLTHWLHRNDTEMLSTAGIIESEKPPHQNRIWYAYPMQRHAADSWDPATWFHEAIMMGTSYSPTLVMRRGVDGGTDQIWQYYYNEYGRLTRTVNAAGHELVFEYEANGIDLATVGRPTTGTQTFSEPFAATGLKPGWIARTPTGYATLDPAGGNFGQIYADPTPTTTVFSGTIDGGSMLCRRIPTTPANIKVKLLNTNFGATQFNRLFMLRASLNASSPNVQIAGPNAQGKMILNTRGAPFHLTYSMLGSSANYTTGSPVTLRFDYPGFSLGAYFDQGSGENSVGSEEFTGMNWACIVDSRQTSMAQNYDDFEITTPNRTVLQSYTYNANHQPLTYTDAKNKTTTFTYNAYGQLKTVKDPLNHTTEWVYDVDTTPGAPGYLQHIKNAKGEIAVRYSYDGFGRVKSVTRGGYTFEYDYDALNRVTKITYADGTSEVFNYNKLDLVSYRDRLHRLTQYTNNKLGQLTSIIDPALQETTMVPCVGCYGSNSVSDPILHATTYARDFANRVIEESGGDSAGGGKWINKYGRNGTLWKVIDPKTNPATTTPTATFTYDGINRVKSAVYATASDNLTYTYDRYPATGLDLCNGIGLLCRVVEGTGTSPPETRFEYDPNGRLLKETRIDSATTFNTNYEYDDAGNLVKTITPTGAEITTPRDVVGRVQGVAVKVGLTKYDIVKNVEYFPDDQVRFQTFGNNLTETRSYNDDGRLVVLNVDDDADGDGMSDAWETAHGLNPGSAADALLDPDGDGLSNLGEFEAQSNPHDPDTDGDSIEDGQDSAPAVSDAAWQIPVRGGVLQ